LEHSFFGEFSEGIQTDLLEKYNLARALRGLEDGYK